MRKAAVGRFGAPQSNLHHAPASCHAVLLPRAKGCSYRLMRLNYVFWICAPGLTAILAAAGSLGQDAGTAAAPVGPALHFDSSQSQALLAVPFQSALANLLDINTITILYRSGPAATTGDDYDQTGLLASPPATFIRAGGGYRQPWTRDASVNSWNAGSLLEPAVARNTLWAVVRRQDDGKLIVQQDNQWWDQAIWVVAAWNHFLVTGDRAFLANAFQTATDTLARDRQLHFNAGQELFEGPAFLNDGIAGYPVPPADATESRGSFVLDYPGSAQLMVLSTNCIFVGAYRSAAAMALALGKPADAADFSAKADALTQQIRHKFWIPASGRFGYLIHGTGRSAGVLDPSQEGAGLAFSILFDVATPRQAALILSHVHTEQDGLPDVYPSFPRYSQSRPGRHNAVVWPPIDGFWASAAAKMQDGAAFSTTVENLARLVNGSDGHFYEIYNGQTGLPDGGWQTGHVWDSQPDQTWSATAYLRMIFNGLFGLRFRPDGLVFQPFLPQRWGNVTLSGLPYRNAILTIRLEGAGDTIRSFRLDQIPQREPLVPATLRGAHSILIELGAPAGSAASLPRPPANHDNPHSSRLR